MIMKWWLPKIIRSFTPLEMATLPTTRTSSNLHAPTISPTAPGPKALPNFNMVVVLEQLPWQFPIHYLKRFAIEPAKISLKLSVPKGLICNQKLYDKIKQDLIKSKNIKII